MALTSTLSPTAVAATGATLARELDWLTHVLEARLHHFFENSTDPLPVFPAPELVMPDDFYAQLVSRHALAWADRLVLALALAPHLRPQALDALFIRNSTYDRGFTEFGGLKGKNHSGFLPTGETALFLLAGPDLAQRLTYHSTLWHHSPLGRAQLVQLGTTEAGEPALSGALTVPADTLALLTTGQPPRPDYSPDFPAKRVSTTLEWTDLVLDHHVQEQLLEMRVWLENQDELLRRPHLRRHLKPGYRALFYGPPGTGKTLTACLLGNITGHEVYRIDLSMVVSKFIGETEKNLGRVFDLAEHRRWILFFDEADALFGKRTATSSSNDRYANQEVAYLLQRIEDFPGIIVLSSNLKANLDEAFARRFQAMIHFLAPKPTERERLWRQAFAAPLQLADDVNFRDLAEEYSLTGGAIINVLRYCVLHTLQPARSITRADIVRGVQREVAKDGKTL
ncbi:ATP-binding protein [Hymenobacter cellulosivorans]|uniref:ATP-binding protein n=1 Tax=Hymenobacter cellulosivorans TaxID=2932249 RepID=A0ABY4F5Z7_9BACT|nr:ATP-binding protein [Hymenobacter cellulosivorans]UOQ52086.1 ATP-binding protein [Hymenobacter cellulosivorans]